MFSKMSVRDKLISLRDSLFLAEICEYMKTPHFRPDLGPTLDRELLTK